MKLLRGCRADDLHVPDASRGGERRARPLPEVPDEAGARRAGRARRGRPRSRAGTSTTAATSHDHAAADGIEWEDDMVEVNRMTTPANMRWKLVDRETGDENAAIDWRSGSATR